MTYDRWLSGAKEKITTIVSDTGGDAYPCFALRDFPIPEGLSNDRILQIFDHLLAFVPEDTSGKRFYPTPYNRDGEPMILSESLEDLSYIEYVDGNGTD